MINLSSLLEAALDTQSENGIDYGNDDDDDDEDGTTKPPSSKKASEEKSSNLKGESEATKKCDGKGCAIADGAVTEAPKTTPRNEHSIHGQGFSLPLEFRKHIDRTLHFA